MSTKDKKRFKEKGVKITDVSQAWHNSGLQGKLLTQINQKKIENIDDVKAVIEQINRYERVSLILLNENGEKERLLTRM